MKNLKIKILNNEWNIYTKSELEMNEFVKGTYGLTTFPDRTINILETLKGNALKQVVRHELTHAIMDESGLANIENVSTEFVCDFVSNNLDIIKELADWIIRRLENENN